MREDIERESSLPHGKDDVRGEVILLSLCRVSVSKEVEEPNLVDQERFISGSLIKLSQVGQTKLNCSVLAFGIKFCWSEVGI